MKKIFPLFTFLICLTFNLSAQINAAFSADLTAGCAPLTVNFTDLSTTSSGTIVTWNWQFIGSATVDNVTDQNPSFEFTDPDDYEVCLIVTNDLGQMDTLCETAYITALEQPIADAGPDIALTCVDPIVDLNGTGSSTGPGINYEWTDQVDNVISNNISTTVSMPGVYTLTVINEGVCNSMSSVSVTEDTNIPVAEITLDTSCGIPYTLTTEGSSTGPNYVYEWLDDSGTTVGGGAELTVFQTGVYNLIVTDVANGCLNQDEQEILNFGNSIISIDSSEVVSGQCFGGNDGTISLVEVSGGQAPYVFFWSTGETSQSIQNLMTGDYTVTIQDENGCMLVEYFTIEESMFINTVGTVLDVSCFGYSDGVLDITTTGGTPPYVYDWSDLPGNDNVEDRTGLVADLYTVTITDSNNCTAEANYLINEPTEIILSFNTQCATSSGSGSIEVVVSGGSAPYLYDWSNGVQGSPIISNLDFGLYQVTVTDILGCISVGEADLGGTIDAMLGGDTTYCDNSQAQLEVIAPNAVTYEWSTGNLSCYDCPNPIATVGLGEETFYSVTVTEASGCIDIGFINFDVQSYLDFDLLEFSNSPIYPGEDIIFDCNVLNVNTVEWIGPAGFTSTECNPVISNADVGNGGIYTLEIVDQYGCEASTNPEVLFYETIESISNDTSICLGESIQLEVTAPDAVSISWSPAISLSDPTIANPIATPITSTNYTVTVENASGGFESASVFVEVVEFPELVPIGPLTVCDGDLALLCAEPGNLPGSYLWTWSTGSSTDFCVEVMPELDGECYELTYTSFNGCIFNDEICIELVDEIIEEDVYMDTICRTEDKELSVDILNPLMVSYEWSPAEFLDCSTCENPIASVLETTIFSVTVSDVNGCTDEAIVELFVDQGCVWPGDTDSSYVVNNFDLLNIGLAYDSTGPIRPGASLVWTPQSAESWTQNAPDGTNYKFIDCNGDGLINAEDTLAITQNWGEVHNFRGEDDVQMLGPDYPQSGITAMVPFYVEPDTFVENETYALPIILGEPGVEAEDVYGIAFTLEYDSAIIVPGSASVGFDGWLGTLNGDMIAIQKTFNSPGVIDIAITRTDGIPMSGFGQLSTLYITIEDDVLLRQDNESRDDDLEVVFNISNVLVLNHLGQEISVVPMETASTVEQPVATTEINWDEYIDLSPNPADEVLYLTAKNIKIEKLKLFSINGELLITSSVENVSTEINTGQLNPGMYLLEVTTSLGVMTEKVMILR